MEKRTFPGRTVTTKLHEQENCGRRQTDRSQNYGHRHAEARATTSVATADRHRQFDACVRDVMNVSRILIDTVAQTANRGRRRRQSTH
jgi:hypothetical protein